MLSESCLEDLHLRFEHDTLMNQGSVWDHDTPRDPNVAPAEWSLKLPTSGGENKLSTTPERFQIKRRKIHQLPISFQSRHCIKSFETSYFLSLFGGGHEKETAHALQQRASVIDFLSSLLSSACRFRSLVSSGGENKLSTTPERFQIWRRKIRQLPISFQSRHCITSFETSDFLSLFGGGQEKETAHALQERASVIYFFSSLVSLQIQISGHKVGSCVLNPASQAEGKINYQLLRKDFKSGGRKIRQLPISFQSHHCITSFKTSYFLSLFGGGQEKETAHALHERASVIYFFSSLVSLQIQISGHKFHSLLADVLKIPVHPDSWAHHLSESTGTKRTRLLGISTLRLAKNKSCCNTIL
ncbi:hypothetical protein AgCh_008357 [Apium graveolens]